jgi:hypothetical protein
VADPGAEGPRYSPFLSVTVPEENHAERIVIPSRSFAARPCTSPAEAVPKNAKMMRKRARLILVNHVAWRSRDCLKVQYFTACLHHLLQTHCECRVMGYYPALNDQIPPPPELKAGL